MVEQEYIWQYIDVNNLCSLEEFTGLMKGQIAARNMDQVIENTFAVFGVDCIDINLLRKMVQVCPIIVLSVSQLKKGYQWDERNILDYSFQNSKMV